MVILTWTRPADDPEAQRPQVPAELVARERQALKDAASRMLAGTSQCQIAREWNKAGLLTPGGREWLAITVRETLLRPGLAGLIEHDGVIVGEVAGDDDPILDRETWYRLRAMILARRGGRPSGLKFVGSGILCCGNCRRPVTGRTIRPLVDGTPRGNYVCSVQSSRGCGKLYASVHHVDEQLRSLVIERLSDPARAAAINTARAGSRDRLAAVRAEIAAIEDLQVDIAAKLGRRELTPKAFAAANAPLAESLARLEAERESLPGGSDSATVPVLTAAEVAARWDAAADDLAERRGMLRMALEGQMLVVEPRRKGSGYIFDPSRVHTVAPRDLAA